VEIADIVGAEVGLMFPGIYEFQWDTGHIVFIGALLAVLSLVGLTLMAVLAKTVLNFRARKVSQIEWQEEWNSLNKEARRCRHAVTGHTDERICQRGFDCRTCAFNTEVGVQALERSKQDLSLDGSAGLDADGAGATQMASNDICFGYRMPSDLYYHRGHTTVQPADDGTALIGLDDFASRLVGQPEGIELPLIGTRLSVNGSGWRITNRYGDVRFLSPIDGTVIETNESGENGWYLKVKMAQARPRLSYLLSGDEVRPWMLREIERLQGMLIPGEAAGLADGGAPLDNLTRSYPNVDWDTVWGEMFLEG